MIKEFVPQIGKVVAINEATVKVQSLKGKYDDLKVSANNKADTMLQPLLEVQCYGLPSRVHADQRRKCPRAPN